MRTIIKKLLARRVRASFTVESAVIIPLFTFITVALIAMGFYVRNTVVIRSLCLRTAIEMERVTTQYPDAEVLGRASGDLKELVSKQGILIKNVRASAEKKDSGGVTMSVSADSAFALPVFGRLGEISVSETADTHNPATVMRRWHALGTVTGMGTP